MTAGDRLKERIEADLKVAGLELTGIEEELVEKCIATADRIEVLEAVVEEHGPTTKGNRGLIVSPALTEIRHQTALLKSLLSGLRLDEDADEVNAAKSKAGRAGAAAKWAKSPGIHRAS
jgi:arginine deiminase